MTRDEVCEIISGECGFDPSIFYPSFVDMKDERMKNDLDAFAHACLSRAVDLLMPALAKLSPPPQT